MEHSNRNLWIGLGLFALLLLIVMPAFGGGMMLGRGMVGPFGARPFLGMPWLWGFWGVGVFARVLFFGLIVWLLVRLFHGRRFGGYADRHYSPTDLSAAEILRRRYAAGEITRDQYEDMRKTLEPATP